MPSIRVIAGAAIGSLFVCGLFGGQGWRRPQARIRLAS